MSTERKLQNPQEVARAAALRTLERKEALFPEKPLARADLITFSKNKPRLPEGDEGNQIVEQILAKVRDRHDFITREEMFQFINGIVPESPDKKPRVTTEQTIEWLHAVFENGLTKRETVNLTLAMAASGDVLNFGNAADKHSSGGVGDKTSLVVGPLAAACGVDIAKMSGPGLGHTGGTTDKLESIPGVSTDLSSEQFRNQLEKIGVVIAGQSHDLAPADGILYRLRNETRTVASEALIAASIMSKKIASGANILVLDVKYGNGAFMKTPEKAAKLAQTMVDIGKEIGMTCAAELSDMNQPLGYAVGNALEVKEAIDTLKGYGPQDFHEHCIETAAEIVHLAGKAETKEAAIQLVKQQLGPNGGAIRKFGEMVVEQGFDRDRLLALLYNPDSVLPTTKHQYHVLATEDGYISSMDSTLIGNTSMGLGAGRASKDEPIEDFAAGVVIARKIGDKVRRGQKLFTIHTNDPKRIAMATAALQSSISYNRGEVKLSRQNYPVIR